MNLIILSKTDKKSRGTKIKRDDNQEGRLVCNKLLKIIYENARTVTCILCGKACHGCSF